MIIMSTKQSNHEHINPVAVTAVETDVPHFLFSFLRARKGLLKSGCSWLVSLLVLLLSLCILSTSGCSLFKKSSRSGGYYQNDGPGDPGKMGSEHFKDAVPRVDPLMSGPNKPYTALGKRYVPNTREVPYWKRGYASWYGKQFHGRPTSSGEKYDMYAMTAAHTTLPIPCYVQVTSVANGRSIIVRVNDRGPFSNKRIIDLSYGAAYRLGFINQGTAEVIVERIMPADIRAGRVPSDDASSIPQSTPPSNSSSSNHVLSGGFYVQIGAYGSQANAQKMQERLSAQNSSLPSELQIIKERQLYKVYAGPYATQWQAQDVGDQIQQQIGAAILILDRR